MSRVAVVGAGGIIGPAIVATLAAEDAVSEIACLDVNGDRAAEVAERHGSGKAAGGALDIRNGEASARALHGATVMVNTASYRINLAAMEAALAAGCHYVDLGGLFHVTREQVKLDDRFRAAGLLAVLGMGSAPGKTSVMATRAVELLGGRVERIVIGASGRDPEPPPGPLVAPYAIETILDELTMPAPVLRDGEVRFLAPRTPAGIVEFGDPVGRAETIYTIHSEQATFAESFGAREVSFQLSLDPRFLAKVDLLAEVGLASADPVEVDGQTVAPRRVLLALLARLPRTEPSRRTVGVHRIEAYGPAGAAVVECVTRAVEGLGFGGGIASTACPPAVVADMICRSELDARGVVPSERAVPHALLFERLEPFGVTVREELRA
ncbi:MAG: saccharopine dehydrogenase NADP-binding domain-containing protein [Gaiellales bacterium]